MQTVLLAAGEGTRMRPLTASRPKPMLPVAGHPLLAHVAKGAIAAGATRLVIVVGYEQDAVRSYFGDEYAGVPIEYAVQSEQRGTAHAVGQATDYLEAGPFVVLNGDALFDRQSLSQLYDGVPLVGSFSVPNPSAYGVLDIDDSGAVVDIEEKPADPSSEMVNTGAYVFPEEAQDWLDVAESSRGELEITDTLERVIAEYDVETVTFERWLDVGRPWELLAANEWKLADHERSIDENVADDATIRGDVVIEDDVTVESGVVIEGPAYLAAGSSVGPNAYIRGATYLGPDAHVGHAVEVKNSVLFEGATAGHLSYIGDSILGADVNFGAGTTVANLRHDDGDVEMTVKGESVSTGRRKFGVVCGDQVKTGINTSLNAGVRLSEGSTTRPGETVFSDKMQ